MGASRNRIIAVVLLLICGALLTYFWQIRLGKSLVYTHYFYLPVVVSCYWFGRKGILTALLCVSIISTGAWIATGTFFEAPHIFRIIGLVAVSVVTSVLSEQYAKVQLRLKENLNKYETVLNTTPTALVLINDDTIITKANKSFAEMVGISISEIENKLSLFPFFSYEDRILLTEYHKKVVQQQTSISDQLTARMVKADKTVRIVSVAISAITGTNESVVSINDITDTKHLLDMKDRLINAQSLLTKITYDCMTSTDESNLIDNVLRDLRKFGYARIAFFLTSSKHSYTWKVSNIDGECNVNALENVINSPSMINKLMNLESLELIEISRNGPDLLKDFAILVGSKTLILIPLKGEGVDYGIIGIFGAKEAFLDEEIRALEQVGLTVAQRLLALTLRGKLIEALETHKANEEGLRKILSEIRDPMMVISKDLKVLWANEAAKRSFEGLREGAFCFQVISKEDRPCKECLLTTSGKSVKDFTKEYNRIPYWVTATEFRSTNGSEPSYLLVFRNLLAHGIATAETARLAHLSAIGELAAGIAHEVNNPLNGIINLVELSLEDTSPDDNRAILLKKVLDEAERASKIIHSLLSFARVGPQEDKTEEDIPSLIEDCLVVLRTQLNKEGIKLELSYEPDLPRIPVRKNQLKQVIFNLFSNSRYALNKKFKGPDPDKIIGVSVRYSDDRNSIEILFKDYGIGIPYSVQNKIFDPFFTTKPPGEGTGLGLSISYSIIKDHKGSIQIESEPQLYTLVKIKLPIKEESEG